MSHNLHKVGSCYILLYILKRWILLAYFKLFHSCAVKGHSNYFFKTLGLTYSTNVQRLISLKKVDQTRQSIPDMDVSWFESWSCSQYFEWWNDLRSINTLAMKQESPEHTCLMHYLNLLGILSSPKELQNHRTAQLKRNWELIRSKHLIV